MDKAAYLFVLAEIIVFCNTLFRLELMDGDTCLFQAGRRLRHCFYPLIHTAGEDNGTSTDVNDFLNIGGLDSR